MCEPWCLPLLAAYSQPLWLRGRRDRRRLVDPAGMERRNTSISIGALVEEALDME